jgi:hypothetical protein
MGLFFSGSETNMQVQGNSYRVVESHKLVQLVSLDCKFLVKKGQVFEQEQQQQLFMLLGFLPRLDLALKPEKGEIWANSMLFAFGRRSLRLAMQSGDLIG